MQDTRSDPLRIALVGPGSEIGLEWAMALRDAPSATLAALVDPTGSATLPWRRALAPHAPLRTHLDDVAGSVDAAVLCLPEDGQHRHVEAALGRGLHVLAHAPLADGPEGGLRLFALAAERRLQLRSGYPTSRVFASVARAVRERRVGAPQRLAVTSRGDGWSDAASDPSAVAGALEHQVLQLLALAQTLELLDVPEHVTVTAWSPEEQVAELVVRGPARARSAPAQELVLRIDAGAPGDGGCELGLTGTDGRIAARGLTRGTEDEAARGPWRPKLWAVSGDGDPAWLAPLVTVSASFDAELAAFARGARLGARRAHQVARELLLLRVLATAQRSAAHDGRAEPLW